MSDDKRFDVSQFGDEIKRILVVAAHPDDLETTSGGTLALLIGRGVEVALLLGTDGDIGTHDLSFTRETLAVVRRQETLAGAAALGIKDVFFLGHHDGELVADLALRAEVADIYRRWQPDTIFTFDPAWGGQAHPDHIAAGRAAVDAYMPSKMELYHPEQLVEGVKVADVSNGSSSSAAATARARSRSTSRQRWETKIAATRCHLSQFGQKEEALEWLAAWNRETGKCCGLEYAEAFHPMQVW